MVLYLKQFTFFSTIGDVRKDIHYWKLYYGGTCLPYNHPLNCTDISKEISIDNVSDTKSTKKLNLDLVVTRLGIFYTVIIIILLSQMYNYENYENFSGV